MMLGWIDFSKTERNKVFSVLDLLSEPGTLDELGIAPVRDGFSNLFFPGTTTIQTRAKYFFIVPYALQFLERSSEINSVKVLQLLDSIEKECGKKFLKQNSEESGIIGRRRLQSGKWVKRTPASIYWSGLKQYKIFTDERLSLAEYVRISCMEKQEKNTFKMLSNRKQNADENECDDYNAGDCIKRQFWNMPLYSDNWEKNLSIKLTENEAEFLRKQIIDSCEGSLLAYVLEKNLIEFIDCKSFTDVKKIINKFPKEIQKNYQLALVFSDFMYLIFLVYNTIISDGQNEFANSELERLKPIWKKIVNIDIDLILDTLKVVTNPLLKKFLKESQEFLFVKDLDKLKLCIKNREKQLKGINRAKTAQVGKFDVNAWFGERELDYRFNNARILVRDIFRK